jgi:hypothetical protein
MKSSEASWTDAAVFMDYKTKTMTRSNTATTELKKLVPDLPKNATEQAAQSVGEATSRLRCET